MKYIGFTLALLCLCLPLASADEETPTLERPDNPVAVIKTSKGDIQVELFAKEAPKTVTNFLGLAEGSKPFKDPKTGEEVTRPFYDGLIFHRVIKDFMIQGGCPLGNGSGDPGYKFEDEIDAEALGLAKMMAFKNGQPHGWMGIRSQNQFNQQVVVPLLKDMGIDQSEEAIKANEAKIQARLDAMTLKDAYELMGYVYHQGVGAHKPVKGVLAMANSGPNTNGSQFFINLAETAWLTGKHTVFGKVIKGMDIVEKIGGVEVTEEGSKPVEDVKILSIRRLGQ